MKVYDGGWLVTPTMMRRSARSTRHGCRGLTPPAGAALRRRPDQGSAAAYCPLPDPRRGACRGAPALDPFGGAVDAARDRSARRAAPMTPYYLMKCGLTALVPYYRPGDPAVADAIKAWPEDTRPCCSPITARWYQATRWKLPVFAIEELEETAKLFLLLRGLNPRYLSPKQVKGFDEDVRVDVAGASTTPTDVILRCSPSSSEPRRIGLTGTRGSSFEARARARTSG